MSHGLQTCAQRIKFQLIVTFIYKGHTRILYAYNRRAQNLPKKHQGDNYDIPMHSKQEGFDCSSGRDAGENDDYKIDRAARH